MSDQKIIEKIVDKIEKNYERSYIKLSKALDNVGEKLKSLSQISLPENSKIIISIMPKSKYEKEYDQIVSFGVSDGKNSDWKRSAVNIYLNDNIAEKVIFTNLSKDSKVNEIQLSILRKIKTNPQVIRSLMKELNERAILHIKNSKMLQEIERPLKDDELRKLKEKLKIQSIK